MNLIEKLNLEILRMKNEMDAIYAKGEETAIDFDRDALRYRVASLSR